MKKSFSSGQSDQQIIVRNYPFPPIILGTYQRYTGKKEENRFQLKYAQNRRMSTISLDVALLLGCLLFAGFLRRGFNRLSLFSQNLFHS